MELKTAPKLKHFLWRMLSQAMVIGTTLVHRGIISDPQCRRCCRDIESADHLFFKCDYAQAIWRSARLPDTILIDSRAYFKTKLRTILDSNSNKLLSPFHRQLPLNSV